MRGKQLYGVGAPRRPQSPQHRGRQGHRACPAIAFAREGADVANVASLPLLPQCAALLANYALFRRVFRADLPAEFSGDDLPDARSVVPNGGYFRAAVLVLVLVGHFAAPFLHVLPCAVAFGGCLTLAACGVRTGRVDWGLLREVSWPVFPFVVGLFVVIGGVEKLGLTGLVAARLAALSPHPLACMAAVAGGAGLASNVLNNLPAALLARSVL